MLCTPLRADMAVPPTQRGGEALQDGMKADLVRRIGHLPNIDLPPNIAHLRSTVRPPNTARPRIIALLPSVGPRPNTEAKVGIAVVAASVATA